MTRFLAAATLAVLAAPVSAAVVDAIRAVPALPAGLSAAAAAPVAVLSAPALTAAPAASLPTPNRTPLSLPAAPSPVAGPMRLPGAASPLPVPHTLEVSDVAYFDWSFLEGPSAAPALAPAPQGPKGLPPSGAAAQLKFAAAAARNPTVTIVVSAAFDASRAHILVPAE